MKKSFLYASVMVVTLLASGTGRIYSQSFTSTSVEEIIFSMEEIEYPIRQVGYGKYRDDFNRLIDPALRKEVKKIYMEQEAAKEVKTIEDIKLPITRKVKTFTQNDEGEYLDFWEEYEKFLNSKSLKFNMEELQEDGFDWPAQEIVFYDGLGRKISDDLKEDVYNIWSKQERRNEIKSIMQSIMEPFFSGFWRCVNTLLVIAVIVFTLCFFFKVLFNMNKDCDKINS